MRSIGPLARPMPPSRWNQASRPKSKSPGAAGTGGEPSVALSLIVWPGSSVGSCVNVLTRTRKGQVARAPSPKPTTRMVKRWPRVARGSTSSSQPTTSTGPSWRFNTGAATLSVRIFAIQKPSAIASSAAVASDHRPSRRPKPCSTSAMIATGPISQPAGSVPRWK